MAQLAKVCTVPHLKIEYEAELKRVPISVLAAIATTDKGLETHMAPSCQYIGGDTYLHW